MAQSKAMAKQRARHALENVTGVSPDPLMSFGTYSTDRKGGSIRSTIAADFAEYHQIVEKDDLFQFFDAETGALVIIPKDGNGRCQPIGGD